MKEEVLRKINEIGRNPNNVFRLVKENEWDQIADAVDGPIEGVM